MPDHDLLRSIGRGSYGDVWLARNVLGEFRAVKIVYRDRFEHERPYEREFEGIRKFEPISRLHESQVDILHVGRDDVAGCFYYVMELADDAGKGSERAGERGSENAPTPAHCPTPSLPHSPASYTPHTLKLDLHRRTRLPVDECIQIGLALATAVQHLHEHWLVHRDIKPSNIIFVGGVPKLADIGLVASMDRTMSFVGTSGFLPPEGPGTPQADLYSLGKVLYEISTGRDRTDFPKLPPELIDVAASRQSAANPASEIGPTGEMSPALSRDAATKNEAGALLELNAVILKACAHDPRQRYQSAQEMAADLALLQRGQSVKRKRAAKHRWIVVKKAAVALGLLLLLAVGWRITATEHLRTSRQTRHEVSPADKQEAERLYQQGEALIEQQTKDGFFRGVECLNQAVAKDPSHVRAYAGLAHGYLTMSDWFLPSKQTAGEVKKNALEALKIDPNMPEGHVWLGMAKMFFDYDWSGAEREFQKAIELDPKSSLSHNCYAKMLQCQGRLPEGRREQWLDYEARASDLDAQCELNFQFLAEGLYDQVIENCGKVLAKSTNHFRAHLDLSEAWLRKGDLERALSEIEICRRLEDVPDVTALLACTYARLGRNEDSRRVIAKLQELERYQQFSAFYYAPIYVALGEDDRALDCLEKAFRERSTRLVTLKADPSFAPLRSSPRFMALLKNVGLEK